MHAARVGNPSQPAASHAADSPLHAVAANGCCATTCTRPEWGQSVARGCDARGCDARIRARSILSRVGIINDFLWPETVIQVLWPEQAKLKPDERSRSSKKWFFSHVWGLGTPPRRRQQALAASSQRHDDGHGVY
jgi:hypothetical protein